MTEKNTSVEVLAKPSTNETQKVEIVSKTKLLEAGVYFGHKTHLSNPKMKMFIHTKRHDIHIIDIAKTQIALEYAYKILQKAAEKNANFMFVGTKKQAKKAVEEQAIRTNSSYVSERWLGGTLTNNKQIMSRVRYMTDLEKRAETNFENRTKKEGVKLSKELAKLQKNLEGIRNLKTLPDIMIVADPIGDAIAIQEARKKKIKVFGILDTNADPSLVDFVIPANDDSIKSITLILTILGDAIATGKGSNAQFAYQPDEKIVLPEDPTKEKRGEDSRKSGFTKYNKDRTNRFNKKEDNSSSEGNSEAKSEETQPTPFKEEVTVSSAAGDSINTMALIKELRERTNSAMVDCKKALEASDWDIEKAIVWLQENGKAKAAKKAGRIAAEGVIAVASNSKVAIMFELNAETDFVSKNKDFLELVSKIEQGLLENKFSNLEEALQIKVGSQTIEDLIINATATIGEKITLRRVKRVELSDNQSVGLYRHSNNQVGSLILLEGNADEELAKGLAMHFTAMNPEFALVADVPSKKIEELTKEFSSSDVVLKKPENIRPMIIQGMIDKNLSETVFELQDYVVDSSVKVQKLLENKKVKLISADRFEVGEGIQKVVSDFASEVAAAMEEASK